MSFKTTPRLLPQRAGQPAVQKRVDPAITRVLAKADPGLRLTVLVKLSRSTCQYANHPTNNAVDSKRAQVFAEDVDRLIKEVSQGSDDVRVVSLAANLGVATLDALSGALQRLLATEAVEGARMAYDNGAESVRRPA